MQVNARLYAVDVEELKRRAAREDTPWHVVLRKLVHEALQREPKLK